MDVERDRVDLALVADAGEHRVRHHVPSSRAAGSSSASCVCLAFVAVVEHPRHQVPAAVGLEGVGRAAIAHAAPDRGARQAAAVDAGVDDLHVRVLLPEVSEQRADRLRLAALLPPVEDLDRAGLRPRLPSRPAAASATPATTPATRNELMLALIDVPNRAARDTYHPASGAQSIRATAVLTRAALAACVRARASSCRPGGPSREPARRQAARARRRRRATRRCSPTAPWPPKGRTGTRRPRDRSRRRAGVRRYDLGQPARIQAAFLQGDNNDDYVLSVSDDGTASASCGMRPRPSGRPGCAGDRPKGWTRAAAGSGCPRAAATASTR